MDAAGSPPNVEQIRKQILDGLAPLNDFAAAMGWHPSTARRRKHELVLVYVGREPYIHIAKTKEKLEKAAERTAARRRGQRIKGAV